MGREVNPMDEVQVELPVPPPGTVHDPKMLKIVPPPVAEPMKPEKVTKENLQEFVDEKKKERDELLKSDVFMGPQVPKDKAD